MNLNLCTLSGKFTLLPSKQVAAEAEALALVQAHAASGGYTNVKVVGDSGDSLRYTARTPGGRGGRNIAFLDF